MTAVTAVEHGLLMPKNQTTPAEPVLMAPTGPLYPGEVFSRSLQVDDDGLIRSRGALFTGASVAFYPDGTRKFRTEYKNGKRDGVSVAWYENGRQMLSTQFVDDQRIGEEIRRNKDGFIVLRTTFVDNKPHGPQYYYRDDESQIKMFTWQDGRIDGIYREWYPSGALHLQGQL